MKKVLVVDDAKFMQTVLTRILTSNGYEVIGYASNGKEAFEKYKELNPDFVTLDITMPEVSGLEGLKMIKDYDSEAKVIMCSAMGQQSYVIESIQNGALDFVVKPFSPERIMEVLNKQENM